MKNMLQNGVVMIVEEKRKYLIVFNHLLRCICPDGRVSPTHRLHIRAFPGKWSGLQIKTGISPTCAHSSSPTPEDLLHVQVLRLMDRQIYQAIYIAVLGTKSQCSSGMC